MQKTSNYSGGFFIVSLNAYIFVLLPANTQEGSAFYVGMTNALER